MSPASGTYIQIKSILAFANNEVVASPRANPWMVETAKYVMGNYGHDPALVRPSALTHNLATPTSPRSGTASPTNGNTCQQHAVVEVLQPSTPTPVAH